MLFEKGDAHILKYLNARTNKLWSCRIAQSMSVPVPVKYILSPKCL